MRNLPINPDLIINTNTFCFKEVPSMYNGFFDVYYNGIRIAIINGLSSPLQWVVKNGSNISLKVIDDLENIVRKLIEITYKINSLKK